MSVGPCPNQGDKKSEQPISLPTSASQTLVKFAVTLSANCTDCQQLILFFNRRCTFATRLKNTNCEAGVNNFLLLSEIFFRF
jgi:hypothetical protein